MNALVLQCGGPTAVVNASLAALVRRWCDTPTTRSLHGGRYGLAALRDREWLPLTHADERWLSAVEALPGMALGGGRDRLDQADVDAAVETLASRGIDTLFLIGGNGTMAAGRALSVRAAGAGRSLRIVGVPKTIDNDIPGTDVCPGFPSAATFLIDAVRDVAADVSSMRGYEEVVLVEAMGRHAGWLTVATLLARSDPVDPPHLVLPPEEEFREETFLDAVRDQHARTGICIVVVSEGVRDRAGRFLVELSAESEIERDASGQVILGRSGGPLPYLATLVRGRLALRCRLVRPDVLQRCSRAHVTALDRTLAAMAGAAAVDLAAAGTGQPSMIALRRESSGWRTEGVPLDRIEGARTVPPEVRSDPSSLRPLVPIDR